MRRLNNFTLAHVKENRLGEPRHLHCIFLYMGLNFGRSNLALRVVYDILRVDKTVSMVLLAALRNGGRIDLIAGPPPVLPPELLLEACVAATST